jgi:hypothetical protein
VFRAPQLELIASYPGLRALAWDGDSLYASRGYSLLRADVNSSGVLGEWHPVALFDAPLWRRLACASRLTSRLTRAGFHGLAIFPDGQMCASVAGAMAHKPAGLNNFLVTQRLRAGTRPLHFAALANGEVYWGEYFFNPGFGPMSIYGSRDFGRTWNVVRTFDAGEIRHTHTVAYDKYAECFWIFAGDDDSQCRVLRAARDWKNVETIHQGADYNFVSVLIEEDALYLASDLAYRQNHIFRMDRDGKLEPLAEINGPSSSMGRSAGRLFFSTMVELGNPGPEAGKVRIYGSSDRKAWSLIAEWGKDSLPAGLFGYGNALFAKGEGAVLAVTTQAVQSADGMLHLFQIV